jgi:hypothetical protein
MKAKRFRPEIRELDAGGSFPGPHAFARDFRPRDEAVGHPNFAGTLCMPLHPLESGFCK